MLINDLINVHMFKGTLWIILSSSPECIFLAHLKLIFNFFLVFLHVWLCSSSWSCASVIAQLASKLAGIFLPHSPKCCNYRPGSNFQLSSNTHSQHCTISLSLYSGVENTHTWKYTSEILFMLSIFDFQGTFYLAPHVWQKSWHKILHWLPQSQQKIRTVFSPAGQPAYIAQAENSAHSPGWSSAPGAPPPPGLSLLSAESV